MDIIALLYLGLGFFLSINQGVTMVLGTYSGGTILGADIVMPSDLFIYALLILQRDKSRQTRYYPLVLTAKILALLFLLLSIPALSFADEPVRVKFQLVHLARAVLIFYFLASRLHDRKALRPFVIGLLFGLGFQSFIGFYQWQLGPISIPFLKTGYVYGRVTGTMEVPNAYGVYLISLFPLIIRILLFTNVRYKVIWAIFTAWSVGALFATYTRGAWVALVIALTLFIAKDMWGTKLALQKKILVVTVGILAVTAIGIKYGGRISRRMAGTTESITGRQRHSRLNLARDAMRIINEHKLLGVGLEQYVYYSDPAIQGLRIVHNAYLLIAAEQGIFALLIFLTLNGMVFFAGLRLLRSRDPLIYNVGSATMTGFVAVCLYHLIAPDYRMIGVLLQHWRLLGMILGLLVCEEVTKRQNLRRKLKQQILSRSQGLPNHPV